MTELKLFALLFVASVPFWLSSPHLEHAVEEPTARVLNDGTLIRSIDSLSIKLDSLEGLIETLEYAP